MTGGLIYLIIRPNQSLFEKILSGIFILGCILFQPIEKIALGKEVWLIVDGIFSILLLIDLFLIHKKEKNRKNIANIS